MPKCINHVPGYCRHRPTGQAYVCIEGRMIYLGQCGTAASRAEYDRVIAEWIAAGRRLPVDAQAVTVAEVIAAFRHHAKTYYRSADGTVSGEVENIDAALRPVLRLYGKTPAVQFGPLRLKAVVQSMIDAGRVRTNINRHLTRIKSVFRWAVANELISAETQHGLEAVGGLRAGRSEAQESDPIQPVAQAHVDAVLPLVSAQVGAMIRLQLLTGARPGEICIVRTADIDASGPVWTFRPTSHKTAHLGHQRTIYIGPKAQDVLRPFLKPLNPAAFIFSPREAQAERRQKMTEARETPLSCGNVPGSNRKDNPKRTPGDRYDVPAYRRAIARACKVAGVPSWHPHQLRHAAATEFRKTHGLEAAQVILGHKTMAVTEIYAEKNVAVAQRVMAAVG
jgi:integrase